MIFRPQLLLLSVLLLAVALHDEMYAQTTTSGGLAGVVTDPSHAVILDADIAIRDNAKGSTQSTKTDHDGVYQFFFLAPGRYTLTVTRVGFREEKRTVNVLLGPPVSVNVTLDIAKASAAVTVTDEAPLIQAENGDVSATLNQKQISEVPNPGNDLTYIAQTTPGVVMRLRVPPIEAHWVRDRWAAKACRGPARVKGLNRCGRTSLAVAMPRGRYRCA